MKTPKSLQATPLNSYATMKTTTCKCGAVNYLVFAGSHCWKCDGKLDEKIDLPEENIEHVETFGVIFYGKHITLIK